MGKIMLNGVDYSAPSQSGVSGVKGNAESTYRTGNVNITPKNIGALATNGDSKDATTTFTSSDVADDSATAWTSVAKLTSGEKHSSIFAKVSQMFKNVRYLYKMLGTTNISAIGNGTVTGALSSLNSNFTWKQVPNDSQQTVSLPSGWKRLYVLCLINNNIYYCFEFEFISVMVESEYRFYNAGYGSNTYVRLGITSALVTINTAVLNGQDVTAASKLYCRYI